MEDLPAGACPTYHVKVLAGLHSFLASIPIDSQHELLEQQQR